ncbi:stressosome-associated protein Prli42 [Neobacillus vireti]|uniref:stressosome-associated protein Prli42 n=1 Tax=Neobacillus vireti TaxID=220686 RepID=UPI002FFE4170
MSNFNFPSRIKLKDVRGRYLKLSKKKTRKIIVYLMLFAMLASTLLLGIASFMS